MNTERVTDRLVQALLRPAADEGALNVFVQARASGGAPRESARERGATRPRARAAVQVFTGDAGPRPEKVAAELTGVPIALAWGDSDRWTPGDGVVASWFRRRAAEPGSGVQFFDVPACGHVPFDDRPQEVADILLSWVATLPRPAA